MTPWGEWRWGGTSHNPPPKHFSERPKLIKYESDFLLKLLFKLIFLAICLSLYWKMQNYITKFPICINQGCPHGGGGLGMHCNANLVIFVVSLQCYP